MTKFKKTILIAVFSILAAVGLIILFISPIAKYLLEKYDVQLTGRQIKIDWAYVNPFTGYVYLEKVQIYEPNGDSLFITAHSLAANLDMMKLFSQTYEITECTLDHPVGFIIQNQKALNFDDVILLFTPKSDSKAAVSPLHFNILKINIVQGKFYYYEKNTPIRYFIKNVNIQSAGKRWDLDTLEADYAWESGVGSGKMKGKFSMNFKTIDYRIYVKAEKYSLNILEQYLKDLTNYGHFSANVDADIHAKGNFLKVEDINAAGLLAINEFHFGKSRKEDYASFDKLEIAIDQINPLRKTFDFDSVALHKPYFKYEKYDHLDNLETMFGKKGVNLTTANSNPANTNVIIEIAQYIKILGQNFLKSSYKIDRFNVYDGNLTFNDYSINEKFSVSLNPVNIHADSIFKSNPRVKIHLKSGIKPFGNAIASLSINPNDSSDFDIAYQFLNVPLSMFNPYFLTFTSFPMDRGTMEVYGKWHVRHGNITSTNQILIIDPRLNKRIKNNHSIWLPMPLLMSIVRERGNIIDYTIPVSGDLKDPDFHLQDVLFDLMANVFVKPLSMPYRINLRGIKTEIEKSLSITWPMRSSTLRRSQSKFMRKTARYLKRNPAATITIYPKTYMAKEKEYILIYEAKKRFYLSTHRDRGQEADEVDGRKIDAISVKDSLFIRYVNGKNTNPFAFTLQEKCRQFIDSGKVNRVYALLTQARKIAFLSSFEELGVAGQVKIEAPANVVPFNGFSHMRITYDGQFPAALVKAYTKMVELNRDAPPLLFEEKKAATN